jgi:uncharacterized ferredoxin-like protein
MSFLLAEDDPCMLGSQWQRQNGRGRDCGSCGLEREEESRTREIIPAAIVPACQYSLSIDLGASVVKGSRMASEKEVSFPQRIFIYNHCR